MKYCLAVLGLLVSIQTVAAERLDLQDAVRELRERGAKSVDAALLFGNPLITGDFDGQGCNLALKDCDRDTHGLDCRSTVLSTCLPVHDLSPTETLELTNVYNSELNHRSTMFRDSITGVGEAAWVKLRRHLYDKDTFDLAEIFEWKLTVRDFEDHVVSAQKKNRSKQVFGIN